MQAPSHRLINPSILLHPIAANVKYMYSFLWCLDFTHLRADGYFKHWSVAYIGETGIMKEIWWTVPSYEQCSALNTAITTHLFVFETTRRSLNFPTGLNGGITRASAIQLPYISCETGQPQNN